MLLSLLLEQSEAFEPDENPKDQDLACFFLPLSGIVGETRGVVGLDGVDKMGYVTPEGNTAVRFERST